jgi:hypothetical protein
MFSTTKNKRNNPDRIQLKRFGRGGYLFYCRNEPADVLEWSFGTHCHSCGYPG